MTTKLVLFLCRCADLVSSTVDLDRVAQAFTDDGAILDIVTHELLCGPEGRALVSKRLRETSATGAVVAACSPRDHEATFGACLADAGLNEHLLAMANIREHCSWVTSDLAAATTKAISLTSGAVARAKLLAPLETQHFECHPDIAVIGGGAAGVEAALLAAESGRKVVLVEREPSLGGQVARVEDLAPALECAPCLFSTRHTEALRHQNLEVMTTSEVVDVVGFLGHFRLTIRHRARWVDPTLCLGMGCDECSALCPVEVPDQAQESLSTRKAIHLPFPGCAPNAFVIDRQACLRTDGGDCRACADGCPIEAVQLDEPDKDTQVEAGAIIVATGFEPHAPPRLAELGHRRLPGVHTLVEVERLLASDGPTQGKLIGANGEPPQRIVVVHCVGRSTLGRCSSFCCTAALKIGPLAKRTTEEVEVVHLHEDLVLRGEAEAALLERATSKGGARLVHVPDVGTVEVDQQDKRLMVAWTGDDNSKVNLHADLVVLVTGMVPRGDAAALGNLLGLRSADSGFFEAEQSVLKAGASTVDGVYLAGCASGPRSAAESVMMAHGAVGLALARVQPGKPLDVVDATAVIDVERCTGCRACLACCPYRALEFEPASGVVEANPRLCRGCGVCAATCPTGAAEARHFTQAQLVAEIREVLRD